MTTSTDTRITLSRIMTNAEANLLGTVHGGNIMKMVDDTAGVAANRFAQGPAVTAAMDEMAFHNPVRVGDVLHVSAQVNWAGRTSMEVGVRAEVDRWDAVTERVHVASAYLVFVAVDDEGGVREIGELVTSEEEEVRRFREAQIRRESRLARREAIRSSREDATGASA
ncbi:acyl-CoA thioesterase [Janibacter cremeus]|uniref:acyl-CoA thioesterase n=1 Tax=Janibacter cremeus TaxID=1285192 RepID=UPI0023F99E7D|nr:acyl-CoA thioesterase [Janibacter cremeus]WEV78520.1 acyl-CoA thioesterase [Janibacter cremeus]